MTSKYKVNFYSRTKQNSNFLPRATNTNNKQRDYTTCYSNKRVARTRVPNFGATSMLLCFTSRINFGDAYNILQLIRRCGNIITSHSVPILEDAQYWPKGSGSVRDFSCTSANLLQCAGIYPCEPYWLLRITGTMYTFEESQTFISKSTNVVNLFPKSSDSSKLNEDKILRTSHISI